MIKQFIAIIKLKQFDNSLKFVDNLTDNIIFDLNLKVVKKIFHAFSPIGITFGYILSQSHIIIHTYPEIGMIHIDLVICSNRKKQEFEKSLKNYFNKHKIYYFKIKNINLTKF